METMSVPSRPSVLLVKGLKMRIFGFFKETDWSQESFLGNDTMGVSRSLM